MSNIEKLDTPERPLEIALSHAIKNVIYEIGSGKMTIMEIIGVIEMVKLEIFETLE
jgi:hypothetical protein